MEGTIEQLTKTYFKDGRLYNGHVCKQLKVIILALTKMQGIYLELSVTGNDTFFQLIPIFSSLPV